ncbi:MAG: STAS domain-containing protein [Nitrospinota bacterium]
MELSVNRADTGIVTVAVSGEVDMNTSLEVRSTLTPLFAEQPKALVVDLSGVQYMDSSGVATLVEGLQWSHRSRIPFRLCGMTTAVKDVFEMARLESLFEIFDTREAALEDLV